MSPIPEVVDVPSLKILVHNMSTGKQVGALSTLEKTAVRCLQFSPFKASLLGAGYHPSVGRL